MVAEYQVSNQLIANRRRKALLRVFTQDEGHKISPGYLNLAG